MRWVRYSTWLLVARFRIKTVSAPSSTSVSSHKKNVRTG